LAELGGASSFFIVESIVTIDFRYSSGECCYYMIFLSFC